MNPNAISIMKPVNRAVSLPIEVAGRIQHFLFSTKLRRNKYYGSKKRRILKNTGVKDKLQDYGLVNIQSSSTLHSVKDVEKKLSSI